MALTKIRNRIIKDAPVNVRDCGAVGNGVADDLVAFQRAVDTGLDVFIPDGEYRLSGAVTLTTGGQHVTGTGLKCHIQSTSSTADIFTVNPAAFQLHGVVLRGLNLYSTVVKSAGAAIRFRRVLRCDVIECGVSSYENYAENGGASGGTHLWDGIVYEACGDCDISDIDGWGFGQDAIRVWGDADFNAELSIRGARIVAAERYGIYCAGGFGGLSLDEGAISACWRNVNIDQLQTSTINREVFINSQFSIDAACDRNVSVGANGVGTLEFNGAWIASAGHTLDIGPNQTDMAGIHIDPDNAALTMTVIGGKFFNNKGPAIVSNGGQIIVNGAHFTVNGAGVTDGHGFWIPTATGNTGPIIVTNCVFDNSSKYDIKIDMPLVYSRIADNVLRGGSSGTLSASSMTLSATNVIQRNIGYRTRADGTAKVLSGNTSVVVTHGLATTPTNIQVTPLAAHPDGDGFYVVTATSTTFTVGMTTAALADRDFYWIAHYGTQI